MHDGLGLSGEVGRVQHEEVARVTIGVVDEGEDPPVVLGRVRARRYEHRLGRAAVEAQVSYLARATVQVVLDERAVVLEERAGVAIAVSTTNEPLVNSGELLTAVVESLLDDLAGG